MKFELNGETYTTRNRRIEFVEIETKTDNGQIMTVVFRGLPLHPSIEEVEKYFADHGGKVVE